MFSLLESVTKAAVGVAVTPLAVVADVATLGGELVDRKQSYTGETLRAVEKNLKNAVKEI
jgi:hypothetical protein